MKDTILKARKPHQENNEKVVILLFVLHVCVIYLCAHYLCLDWLVYSHATLYAQFQRVLGCRLLAPFPSFYPKIWRKKVLSRKSVLTFRVFFSSPEPSGSQGELIVYPYSGVRCRRCRRRQQCLNIFSSETALPIKAKFYVEPPWEGGTKFI